MKVLRSIQLIASAYFFCSGVLKRSVLSMLMLQRWMVCSHLLPAVSSTLDRHYICLCVSLKFEYANREHSSIILTWSNLFLSY